MSLSVHAIIRVLITNCVPITCYRFLFGSTSYFSVNIAVLVVVEIHVEWSISSLFLEPPGRYYPICTSGA